MSLSDAREQLVALKWDQLPASQKLEYLAMKNDDTLQDIEMEWAVLGSCMGPNASDIVLRFPELVSESFYYPAHQDLWTEIAKYVQAGVEPEPVVLLKRLKQYDSYEKLVESHGMKPSDYIARILDYSNYSFLMISEHVRLLLDLQQRRTMVRKLRAHVAKLSDADKNPDTDKIVTSMVADVIDVSQKQSGVVAATFATTNATIIDDFAEPLPCTPTGLPMLDDALQGGLYQQKTICVAARPKIGKAQPTDTPVLTLDAGMKPIGDLRVGDRLASVDGGPSEVSGVFPQGEKEIWKVVLDDGREVECCPEHLWRVHIKGLGWVVLDTRELKDRLAHSRSITLPQYFGFDDDCTVDSYSPIPPYLLGVLLGDGGLSVQHHITLSLPDEQVGKQVAGMLGGDLRLVNKDASTSDYYITRHPDVKENWLLNELRALNMMGKKSVEKEIPDSFMNLSTESRWELIRGMMDTDGTAQKNGHISYSTSSKKLAYQFQQLCWSVGASARVLLKKTAEPYSDAYIVSIRHPDRELFFSLPRKRLRAEKERKRYWRPRVVDIVPSRRASAVCISVTHPTHTYVTTDYVVTHNTMLMGSIHYNISMQPKKALYYAFEMGSKELHFRYLARFMGINSTDFYQKRNNPEFQHKVKQAAAILQRVSNGMYVDCPNMTFDEFKRSVTSMCNQHEPVGFFVDYLGKLKGQKKGQNRSEFEEEIADWLHGFVKRNNIWAMYACQLNREGNLRGSDGALMGADAVFTLEKDNEVPVAWMKCTALRYAPATNVGKNRGTPGLRIDSRGPHYRCASIESSDLTDLEKHSAAMGQFVPSNFAEIPE